MRVDVADQAYAALRAAGRSVRVWLDGVEQTQVIWADEEAGELQRFEIGPDGRPLSVGDTWLAVVHRGAVKVVIVDRCPQCGWIINGPGVEGADCKCA
jgi:hypothetical protein